MLEIAILAITNTIYCLGHRHKLQRDPQGAYKTWAIALGSKWGGMRSAIVAEGEKKEMEVGIKEPVQTTEGVYLSQFVANDVASYAFQLQLYFG